MMSRRLCQLARFFGAIADGQMLMRNGVREGKLRSVCPVLKTMAAEVRRSMKTLILVPTKFEADLMRPWFSNDAIASEVPIHVCGFGVVTSGISTARLIAEYCPQRVILTGIAGTLSDELKIGAAYQFSRVGIYGVGAGHGVALLTPQDLGWDQLSTTDGQSPIGDTLTLVNSASAARGTLVTCCAASASPTEASWRRSKFLDALAEDMEGFSVAVACHLAKVPLEIIRGISNVAGVREKEQWQIAPAIAAVAKLVSERLQ